MKISIITPCYNVEKYLQDFFTAITRQTYKNFELICVDDGSTDKTWEMLQQFSEQDNRVIVYKMPQNSGGCKIPRDTAASMASTDWLIRVDADDFMEDEYVEKIVKRQKETGADAIASCSILYDGDAEVKEITTVPAPGFDYQQIVSGREGTMMTVGSWKMSVSGLLIKRSIYMATNRFLKKTKDFGKTNEDENDMREMLMMSKTIAFTDAKYYYRQNPTSITHRAPEKFLTHRAEQDLYNLIAKTYGADSSEAKIALAAYIRNIMRTIKRHRITHHDVLSAMRDISAGDVMRSTCPFGRKLMYIARLSYYKWKYRNL